MDDTKTQETRIKLLSKVLPQIRKNGFQSLTMDEIAKLMGVSRATLYKYFSTKEAIISFMISECVEFIHKTTEITDISDFANCFQQIFEQSVLLIEYCTEIFMTEVKMAYPENYVILDDALKVRNSDILNFYNEGIKHGIFNNINGIIAIKQDEILRSMLNISFLMANNLTVRDVISEYYLIKKIQLFRPDKISLVDDHVMAKKIDYLAHKITQNLI
ncbi:TetR/AcrR family transcriptional regulator [Leuconostoc sp. MS02]|uniref:TetR/AcrR family transcriptional regulator n=1 Tax=Leuconostoc aquikimchii TaxID=3236804 RepID=A0ABV3S1A1_9LACO